MFRKICRSVALAGFLAIVIAMIIAPYHQISFHGTLNAVFLERFGISFWHMDAAFSAYVDFGKLIPANEGSYYTMPGFSSLGGLGGLWMVLIPWWLLLVASAAGGALIWRVTKQSNTKKPGFPIITLD